MDTVERKTPVDTATFDGFISYSHAADGFLAPRLQSGLQRFAKPWWRRRALRIFRDESSLSANPHLWSSITEALDKSNWFVLLLSPDAAQSPWVNQEIEYWNDHKDSSRILPVVTDGEFAWDGDVTGDSAPEALRGVFSEEPRWVDLRFAHGEEQLDLKNSRFSAAVADIASALRGIPKDELESEEVKQHRRTIRTAWAAAFLVLLLGVAAVVAAIQSTRNAAEAERQAVIAEENEATARAEAERADANAEEAEESATEAERAAQLAKARELASASIANLERNPELATLLALTALERAPPETDDRPVELVNAIWQAGSSNRLVDVIETGYDGDISLSADGSRLAATTSPQTLAMIDAQTHEVLWEYSEETVDSFVYPIVGPDGRTSLGIYDSEAEWHGLVDESDDLPNRVVILTSGGEIEAAIEFPECTTAGNTDWSPEGHYLAIGFGGEGCIRNGANQWVAVYETADWTEAAFLTIEGEFPLGPSPRFDANGRLYALRSFERNVIFEAETFEQVEVSEASGVGDVTPDGSRMLGFYTLHGNSGRGGTGFSVLSFATDTGEISDILYTGIRYPSVPFGVTATEDGQVIVAVGGATAHIYDVITGEELLRLPTGPVETIGYDAQRELLYTSGSEEGPRVWDLGAASVGITSTGDLGDHPWVNGNSFVIGPDVIGAFAQADLAAGTPARAWQTGLFHVDSGDMIGSIPSSAPSAALSNGRFLLAYYGDHQAAIYDPETDELHPFFECQNVDPDIGCLDPGFNVVVSFDGTELYAYPWAEDGTLAGEVHTLDPDTGRIIRTDPISEDELSPNLITKTWVLGSPTSRIDYRVRDRASGEILWQDELEHLRHEVSADRRWLLTRGDQDVQLVDTETWAVEFVLGGFNNVRGTAFNASGGLLAVADVDSMRIIDIETGLIAQQVQLPGVSDIHFLDDETIVVGTNNGVFGTVSLSTDDLIQRTRDNLRRTFTEQECAAYQIEPCPTLEEMREG